MGSRPPQTLVIHLRRAAETAELSPFGEALVGAVGGIISNAIVYPLDTVKTRLQAEEKADKEHKLALANGSSGDAVEVRRPPGGREMVAQIWREGNVFGFYRGFHANMLNSFSMQFAYFYWYTIVRRTYLKRAHGTTMQHHIKLNTLTELVLGALAGALGQIFTIPVSVIATRQQLAEKSTTFASTLKAILSEDGVTGLWRGLKPSLVLTVNPAITYGVFERLRSALIAEDVKMSPYQAFCMGAISKTLATVVTYPYILSKIRLQAKYDDDEETAQIEGAEPKRKRIEKYKGAIDVLKQIYKQKGFAGWYQGMQAHILKAVLSQALLFGIKDALEVNVILALVYLSSKNGRAIGLRS